MPDIEEVVEQKEEDNDENEKIESRIAKLTFKNGVFCPTRVKVYVANPTDQYFNTWFSESSQRHDIITDLCNRRNPKCLELLWATFPDELKCTHCSKLISRQGQKKLWWNFPERGVFCMDCAHVEDVRKGHSMTLSTILSPSFSQCLQKYIELDPYTYDFCVDDVVDKVENQLPFIVTASIFTVLNDLRNYTRISHEEDDTKLRNDLFETRMNPPPDMQVKIDELRDRYIEITSLYRALDTAFAFALRSIPTYLGKRNCKCEKS